MRSQSAIPKARKLDMHQVYAQCDGPPRMQNKEILLTKSLADKSPKQRSLIFDRLEQRFQSQSLRIVVKEKV